MIIDLEEEDINIIEKSLEGFEEICLRALKENLIAIITTKDMGIVNKLKLENIDFKILQNQVKTALKKVKECQNCEKISIEKN